MNRISRSLVFSGALLAASAAHADDTAVATSASSAAAVSGSSLTASAVAAESLAGDPAFSSNEPRLNTEIEHQRFPNVPLLATGSVLLGASYLPAVVGAAISDRDGDDNLYIPVAGPWMAYARGAEEKPGYKALLVANGVAQGLGGLMMLTSLMIPEERTRTWRLIGQNDDFRLAPQVAWNSVGLGASGRF